MIPRRQAFHRTRSLSSDHPFSASVFALLVVALGFSSSAPAAPSPEPPPSKISVLTSFLPVHSLASSIAGHRADVQNWLPAGVDPHDFQFSPRDLRRLRSANLLIIGGLGLEGWNQAKLKRLASNPQLQIVDSSAGIPKSSLVVDGGHSHGHEPGSAAHVHDDDVNPHFWLDPLLMLHAVSNIVRGLSAADPAGADTYAANAKAVSERLNALHRDFSSELAPLKSRAFITYHNAFPYLARRYELSLVGVVESGPSSEPTARRLVDLGRMVRNGKATVLFVDGEPPRLAERLASDLKLKLATLETLERGEFSPTAYEEGMRRNLEVLKKALSEGVSP